MDKTLTVQHGYQFPGAHNTGSGKDVFVKRKRLGKDSRVGHANVTRADRSPPMLPKSIVYLRRVSAAFTAAPAVAEGFRGLEQRILLDLRNGGPHHVGVFLSVGGDVKPGGRRGAVLQDRPSIRDVAPIPIGKAFTVTPNFLSPGFT